MADIISKEAAKQLVQEHDLHTMEDVNTLFKSLFASTLQAMLEAEMDNHLGYQKNDQENKETSNRRNGHTLKTVRSEQGNLEIEVPRDRYSDFSPVIVGKRQKSINGIEGQIIELYAHGMSTRDIQDHLAGMYGVQASATLISHVTDKVLPLLREWQDRPLKDIYAMTFLDAIHYKVREDGAVRKKAAYIVIGVDLNGQKDVLGTWIGENESSRFWLKVLNELKVRGVQDILICCTDNLTGFTEAIEAAFARTEVQKCIIHQLRNSLRYVSWKERARICHDLKRVYQATSEEEGYAILNELENEWGRKYQPIADSWKRNWSELSTFFKFPPELRKVMYTTNVIEGFNRQLRKVTKSKSSFPNDESLLKMLYLVTEQVTRKWTHPMANWAGILAQLSILFPDRIPDKERDLA